MARPDDDSPLDELDEADRAFLESIVPDDAIPVGFVAVVAWIDPDDGGLRWRRWCQMDAPTSTVVGLLDVAKTAYVADILDIGEVDE